MYAVILAGGVGTRLWPRSRQSTPKQFSDITGAGRTMIQATADRLEGLVAPEDIFVITGSRYGSLAAAQLNQLPAANILMEPNGRNTAAAIALACVHLQQHNPAAVVAFLPADHVIQDCAAFQQVLQQAERSAQLGYLTVLGIEPNSPHTGYGYIKYSRSPLPLAGERPTFAVERFLEKPDQATAEAFLTDGGYYWNSGICVSRVDRLLAEYERQMPALFSGLTHIAAALNSPLQDRVLAEVWPTMPNMSIDYGLLEGADKVAVVSMQVGWNDVGSWDALETFTEKDEAGNCAVEGDILPINSQGNIIATNGRLVALIDVDDLVVVDTEDALLIGRKKSIQQVKQIVAQLQACQRNDLL